MANGYSVMSEIELGNRADHGDTMAIQEQKRRWGLNSESSSAPPSETERAIGVKVGRLLARLFMWRPLQIALFLVLIYEGAAQVSLSSFVSVTHGRATAIQYLTVWLWIFAAMVILLGLLSRHLKRFMNHHPAILVPLGLLAALITLAMRPLPSAGGTVPSAHPEAGPSRKISGKHRIRRQASGVQANSASANRVSGTE